jgi:hypothetical protein
MWMLDLLAGGIFFHFSESKKSQNFTSFLLTFEALAWYFNIIGWWKKYYFFHHPMIRYIITGIPEKRKDIDKKNQFFYTVLEVLLT